MEKILEFRLIRNEKKEFKIQFKGFLGIWSSAKPSIYKSKKAAIKALKQMENTIFVQHPTLKYR
jgi:hypothetical protein